MVVNIGEKRLKNIELIPLNRVKSLRHLNGKQGNNGYYKRRNKESITSYFGRYCEEVVRLWVEETGSLKNHRVLSYQQQGVKRGRKKWEKKYRELDLVFKLNGNYWIGEVKTTWDRQRRSKAIQNLRNIAPILQNVLNPVNYLVIHVDLRFECIGSLLDAFYYDFSDMYFSKSLSNGFEVHDLRVSPISIWKYGERRGLMFKKHILEEVLKRVRDKDSLKRANKNIN